MMPKQKQKSRGSVRSLFLSAVILAICVILAACGEPQSSCSEELDALLAGAARPAGVTYICGAVEGGESYLAPETARALYGEDAEAVLSLCEDFAIFLSERPNPFEAAVLRCYSASDCDKVARMLLSRIEDIRIALRGTELAGAYDTAEVKISGRTVTMRGGVQNISK